MTEITTCVVTRQLQGRDAGISFKGGKEKFLFLIFLSASRGLGMTYFDPVFHETSREENLSAHGHDIIFKTSWKKKKKNSLLHLGAFCAT